METLHLARMEPGVFGTNLGREGARKEGPDRQRRRPTFATHVGTEDGERIRMASLDERVDVAGRQCTLDHRGGHTSIVRGSAARDRGYTT
jgi:hypothetical protein